MAKFVNVPAKIDGPQGTTAEIPMLVNVDSIDNVVGFAPTGSRINLRGGIGLVVAMPLDQLHKLLEPPSGASIAD